MLELKYTQILYSFFGGSGNSGCPSKFKILPPADQVAVGPRFLTILQNEKTGEATLSFLLQVYALFYMGLLELTFIGSNRAKNKDVN